MMAGAGTVLSKRQDKKRWRVSEHLTTIISQDLNWRGEVLGGGKSQDLPTGHLKMRKSASRECPLLMEKAGVLFANEIG